MAGSRATRRRRRRSSRARKFKGSTKINLHRGGGVLDAFIIHPPPKTELYNRANRKINNNIESLLPPDKQTEFNDLKEQQKGIENAMKPFYDVKN